MKATTHKALLGSIEKWEKIVARTGGDESTSNCPLCAVFYEEVNDEFPDACAGCPVSTKTGKPYCDGSPYAAWAKIKYDEEKSPHPWLADSDKSRRAAKLELAFLKRLLQPGLK